MEMPGWKYLKHQEFNVCFNRRAEKNSTVKNMNGGILRERSSSYWCKQNVSEKSIYNKIITFSKLFYVKQNRYDNLYVTQGNGRHSIKYMFK